MSNPITYAFDGLEITVDVENGGGSITTNLERAEVVSGVEKYNDEGKRSVYCGNCDWTGVESSLEEDLFTTPDLADRLAPGEEVPVGTCPDCGALCYLSISRDLDEERESALQYNAAIDALESMILAHACRDIHVGSSDYLSGIIDAQQAIAQHFPKL